MLICKLAVKILRLLLFFTTHAKIPSLASLFAKRIRKGRCFSATDEIINYWGKFVRDALK